MPRKHTELIYTFKELLELEKQGKEKGAEAVRCWYSEIIENDEWADPVIEMWQDDLDAIGFHNVKVQFSGFWSQGDGASFTAKVDGAVLVGFLANPPEPSYETTQAARVVKECDGVQSNPKFIKLIKVFGAGRAWLEIVRHGHHYAHERTCRVDADLIDRGMYVTDGPVDKPGKWQSMTPKVRRLWEDFVSSVEQLRLDVCRAIYSDLEDAYEGATSDEAIEELADANDWYFTRGGDFKGSFDSKEDSSG